jgi:uncharacterized protein YerC
MTKFEELKVAQETSFVRGLSNQEAIVSFSGDLIKGWEDYLGLAKPIKFIHHLKPGVKYKVIRHDDKNSVVTPSTIHDAIYFDDDGFGYCEFEIGALETLLFTFKIKREEEAFRVHFVQNGKGKLIKPDSPVDKIAFYDSLYKFIKGYYDKKYVYQPKKGEKRNVFTLPPQVPYSNHQ